MFSNPMPLDIASRSRGPSRAKPELNGSRVQTFSQFPTGMKQDEPHWPHEQAQMRAREVGKPRSLVNVAPSESAERRTIAWSENIYADLVRLTDYGRVEFRFRAPVHLLVAYERGTRREGQSLMDGLPRSSLRDLARKLTFVPAGHQLIERHEPRILRRISSCYFDP